MAELTPHLIEGLMSNIPPQQDFRQAVTIVSADPGSVVYRIEVPQDQCNYTAPSSAGSSIACWRPRRAWPPMRTA